MNALLTVEGRLDCITSTNSITTTSAALLEAIRGLESSRERTEFIAASALLPGNACTLHIMNGKSRN